MVVLINPLSRTGEPPKESNFETKAQVLGLGNVGGGISNSIKVAREFGIDKNMTVVAVHLHTNDVRTD